MAWYLWLLPIALGGLCAVVIVGILLAALVAVFTRGPNLNPVNASNPGVTGGPPATQGSGIDWTFGFPSSRFWKLIWMLLFIAMVITTGWFAYQHFFGGATTQSHATPTSSQSTWDPTDGWLVPGLALLAILGLVIWNRRAIFGAPVVAAGISVSLPSLPKTGSLLAQLLTSMLVFALVLYALWGVSPNAKLFTTPEGWVTILIYVVAMTAAALVAVNLKGWAKLTPAVGLFIFFSLTGVHSWMLLNSDGVFEQRTHIAASLGKLFSHNPSTSVAAGTSANGCISEQVPLDANTVADLNPHNCDLKLAYPNQCLALRRADWTLDTTWYNVCDIPGRNTAAPNNIRYAYSTSPVVMFVQRRPH